MADAGEKNRMEQLKKQVAKSKALKAQGLKVEVQKFPYMTRLNAKLDGKTVGYLDLNNYDEANKGREIRQVTTTAGNERKGIASTLYNEAKKLGLKPLHSNQLSSEGQQFMQSVGGRKVKPVTNTPNAQDLKAFKEMNKQIGQQKAVDIAKQRTGTISAMNKALGRTNMGLGIFNVLGYLPMLDQAGKIMSGRSSMYDSIGQMR